MANLKITDTNFKNWFLLVSYLTNVRVTPGNHDLAMCSASVHPWEARVGKVCAVDVGG
jgi:hypothetical protein